MKRPRFEQNYNDILRKDGPPGITQIMDTPIEHRCSCGVSFLGSRNAVWCPACRPAAVLRSAAKSQANQKAKRAARRAMRPGKATA